MATNSKLSQERQVERLERRFERRLLYITLTLVVVGPRPGRPEDSKDVVELRRVHELSVLMRPSSGRRWVRRGGDVTPEPLLSPKLEPAFRKIAERARHIDLVFTVTEEQYEFVTDDVHRVVAAFGGQGGGKTHAAGLKHIRSWLLYGGRGVKALSLSPSRKQTQIVVEKLCKGEDVEPPLIPAELLVHYPDRHESGGQYIEFIDGTRIVLDYVGDRRQGGNIKGIGPRWIGIDEVCEIPYIRAWRIIRGRLGRGRGGRVNQCFMSSTPEAAHWAELEVVHRVHREGAKSRYWYCTLTSETNPYVSTRELAEAIEDQGGRDDPTCQREVLGRWSAGTSRAFYNYQARRHIRSWDDLVEARRLRDVTRVVARDFFYGTTCSLKLVAGQDFNLWPMSTVMLRVGQDSEGKLVAVVTSELLTKDAGSDAHAELLVERFGMLPISCDPAGAQMGDIRRVGDSRTDKQAFDEAGHDCRPAHRNANRLPYRVPMKDSMRLANKFLRDGRLYIDPSCRELLKSLARCQATPEGGIVTFTRSSGSSRPEDRLKGPADALRYILWALFRAEMFGWDFHSDELDDRDPGVAAHVT